MRKKVVALGVGLTFLFKINQGQFCPLIKVLGATAIVLVAPSNTHFSRDVNLVLIITLDLFFYVKNLLQDQIGA